MSRVKNSSTHAPVGSRCSFCRQLLRSVFLHRGWLDFFGQGDKFAFRCHSPFFVKVPRLGELRGSVFLCPSEELCGSPFRAGYRTFWNPNSVGISESWESRTFSGFSSPPKKKTARRLSKSQFSCRTLP
jgi:hypothetical protein